MFRHLCAPLALLLLPALLQAVPAPPWLLEGESEEGRFRFRQVGDEFLNWGVSEDGCTILQADNGLWYYAEHGTSGELQAGALPVRPDAQGPASARDLRPDPEWIEREIAPLRARQLAPPPGQAAREQRVEGEWNVCVLLINFPDASHSQPAGNFELLMNEEDYGGVGSFRNYWEDMSHGRYSTTASVFGWYTAEHEHDWYGYNNGYERAQALVVEAVEAADAEVDFSLFDNSGNGSVDALMIVHQGYGAEEGNHSNIWSHRWSLWGVGPLELDGVDIWDYTMQPEMQQGDMVDIGVYVHEFGHALGLPDLYDTDYSSDGIGQWCVMSGGSWGGPNSGPDRPAALSAWCRMDLEWSTVTTTSSTLMDYGLCALHLCDEVIRLEIPGSFSEFFLVENRQETAWDQGISEAGMLVWHVDQGMAGNTEDWHRKVDLEQADGLYHLNSGFGADPGDPFPGSSDRRTFNTDTTPDSRGYNNAPSPVAIYNISDSADTMRADFHQLFPHQRLVVEAVEVLSDDNGDQWLDPGENATIRLRLRHTGTEPLNSVDLQLLDNDWMTVTSGTQSVGPIEADVPFYSEEAGFQIQVSAETTPGNHRFSLRSEDDLGWIETVEAETAVGRAQVLLINDDSSTDSDGQHDLYFSEPLEELGYTVERRSALSGAEWTNLDLYEHVVYYSGRANQPLDETERQHLLERIAQGGSLLLSGQRLAQGAGGDLLEACGLGLSGMVESTPILDPAENAPLFSAGERLLVTGGQGAFNQEFPTAAISATSGQALLQWAIGGEAAVLREHPSGSRLAFMAFSLEAIHGAASFLSRQEVLARLMAWLENSVQAEPLSLPASFAFSIAPNPFNPTTLAEFALSRPGQVDLSVYDLRGRRVLQQNLGLLQSGVHRQLLDLGAHASGIYFVRLEAEGERPLIRRALLIK